MKLSKKITGAIAASALGFSANAIAGTSCSQLMDLVGGYNGFAAAADEAYSATLEYGFGLGMWATLMDTSGIVCAVYSVDGDAESPSANGGKDASNTAWLGSRVISAQKANTANAFSLDELSIPTGAITGAVYEGGSLYGLQFSNPVDATKAYKGSANTFGKKSDTLVGKRPGGVNVFGGGIALYDNSGKVGAVGVSGDTSCRDAAMAYTLRGELGLDETPNPDILYLVSTVTDVFQQPICTTPALGVLDPNDPALGVVDTTAE
jgi:uncharacterized protein GlcG (DUF336 family)